MLIPQISNSVTEATCCARKQSMAEEAWHPWTCSVIQLCHHKTPQEGHHAIKECQTKNVRQRHHETSCTTLGVLQRRLQLKQLRVSSWAAGHIAATPNCGPAYTDTSIPRCHAVSEQGCCLHNACIHGVHLHMHVLLSIATKRDLHADAWAVILRPVSLASTEYLGNSSKHSPTNRMPHSPHTSSCIILWG